MATTAAFAFLIALATHSAEDSSAARLERALAPLHERYDPAEKMLRRPFSSPGYHTTLGGGFVHPTRDSLEYALALLETGEEEHLLRAAEVLRRVIGLQDADPSRKTYGIWPWFLEEPLDRMSPPDWNWADFCGGLLLQASRGHRARLPADLAAAVDASVLHAARAIRKRDVGPGYTNICILGAYVTLVAGETYGVDDLREYGVRRIERLASRTFPGGFAEYNSPTYTVVSLGGLARILRDAKDPRGRAAAGKLYRAAWEEMALHFHAPSRQWAGPHSRAYRDFTTKGLLSLIRRATEGRIDLGADEPSLEESRLPLPCPPDLEPCFRELREPVERTWPLDASGDPPVVLTTYLHPAFALGSASRADLWNQRRPLIAYWGTPDAPSGLRVRLLHDGYDFAAARIHAVQREGDVLAGISIATDGGDRHPSLDRIRESTIRARDLRIRFELDGEAGKTQPSVPADLGRPAAFTAGEVSMAIAVPLAVLDGERPRWEAGSGEGRSWLDVVLHEGAERTFDLSRMEAAGTGLAVRIAAGPADPPAVSAEVREGTAELDWPSRGLRLHFPLKPGKDGDLARMVETSGSVTGPTSRTKPNLSPSPSASAPR